MIVNIKFGFQAMRFGHGDKQKTTS